MSTNINITLYGTAKKIIQEVSEVDCVSDLPVDVVAKLQLLRGDVYIVPKERMKVILARHTNEWEDDIPF